MRIALDIDDTITAAPALFAALSQSPLIARCIVVSSRSNEPTTRAKTEAELLAYGINYDQLYLIDSIEQAVKVCPHQDLDWYQKYLWQKVKICLDEKIDIIVEDDEKVLALFARFAPRIQRVQMQKNKS